MKKNDKIVAAAVVAVLVVGLIFYLSRGGGDETGAAAVQPESVRLADVTQGPIREEVKLTGEVKAIADVNLASKVSGRLVSIEVEEGDYVDAAALVAMLDRDVFEAAVREDEAAVQVARANAKMAQVVRENAGLEYERVKSLFEQGTVPESNRDDAHAAHSKAAAGVEVADAAVLQAQAALERAKINLNESRLVAPFDGVVADRLLDVGSFVSPGTPILRLVSVDTVKVTAGAAERYLGDLEVGRTRVVVTVDSLPGRSFPGMLHFISPVIDAGTRTAEVEIRIPNKERLLKPGMYARVNLVTRQRDRAVLVPNDAVLGRGGDYYVFVEDGGRVRRTPIDLDLRAAPFSEATAGLEGGEKVVISGAGNLLDGAQVIVREEPAP